mmetsp:Transcript_5558/g.16019  ORF Transcript_5558/g.16019 Transcript_5558/m.16019 type:complete len:99 (-) Transcript_5558:536-832(-)
MNFFFFARHLSDDIFDQPETQMRKESTQSKHYFQTRFLTAVTRIFHTLIKVTLCRVEHLLQCSIPSSSLSIIVSTHVFSIDENVRYRFLLRLPKQRCL